MPRTTPIGEKESAIIDRLRSYREILHLSRIDFAQEIGLDSEVLSRLENQRIPLRCDVFWKINRRFPLNPLWLATGEDEMSLVITLPEMKSLGVRPTDLFSEAYAQKLHSFVKEFAIRTTQAELEDNFLKTGTYAPTARGRLEAITRLETKIDSWIAAVPDASLNEFASQLEKLGEQLYRDYLAKSSDSMEDVLRRGQEVDKLRDEIRLKAAAEAGKNF